jgi:glycolate oxidase FAD binding subunit
MLIDDMRFLRLSGSAAAVRAAAMELGGDIVEGDALWSGVAEHLHPFFTAAYEAKDTSGKNLWRISVADATPALALEGDWLYEWAGAQRWLSSTVAADEVYTVVAAAQGHATCYTPAQLKAPAFQPLDGAMLKLQSRVRDSFDPMRLFNRGRFHPEFDTADQLAATGS